MLYRVKIVALGDISKSGWLLWISTGALEVELIKTTHIGKNVLQFIYLRFSYKSRKQKSESRTL